MNLQFTLKEMENMLEETKKNINDYNSAIDELDKIINDLSLSWVSKETKTYETFYSNYKINYLKLINMKEMMENFYNKIEEQKTILETTAIDINKNFE